MESRRLFLLACLLTPLAAGCVLDGSDTMEDVCIEGVGCVGEDPRLRRAPGCSGTTTCIWLPDAENRTVAVLDNAFAPATLHARVGDTVRWFHAMQGRHGVAFPDSARAHESFVFDARNALTLNREGDAFSLMPLAPGTYEYACRFHPEMKGTLIVVAADTPPEDNAPVGAVTAPRAAAPRGVVEFSGVAFDPDQEAVAATLRVGGEAPQVLDVEARRWRASWDASSVEEDAFDVGLTVDGGRGAVETATRVRLEAPRMSIRVDAPEPGATLRGVAAIEGGVEAAAGDLATFGWRVLPEGNTTLIAVRGGQWAFDLDARVLPPGPVLVALEAASPDGYRITRTVEWVVAHDAP